MVRTSWRVQSTKLERRPTGEDFREDDDFVGQAVYITASRVRSRQKQPGREAGGVA
jgi:hypothetical protein